MFSFQGYSVIGTVLDIDICKWFIYIVLSSEINPAFIMKLNEGVLKSPVYLINFRVHTCILHVIHHKRSYHLTSPTSSKDIQVFLFLSGMERSNQIRIFTLLRGSG